MVHFKTRAKLGAAMHGSCLGLDVATEADVSIIPDAQGETLGFRDPRIDRLSESKELNFFLIPFLSKKLPQQMKVNVADLLRRLLVNSTQTTSYAIKLEDLKIHSMQVSGHSLVVDFNAGVSVDRRIFALGLDRSRRPQSRFTPKKTTLHTCFQFTVKANAL